MKVEGRGFVIFVCLSVLLKPFHWHALNFFWVSLGVCICLAISPCTCPIPDTVGSPVCHIAMPYSYRWDMKVMLACQSPATFWYLTALSGSRDSDQTMGKRKVISYSSDLLWRPPSLVFSLCREQFPWGWSGRGVKLASHLHQVPRLRMRGCMPSFSMWRNGA